MANLNPKERKEREKLYSQILKAVKPLEKKFGVEKLRWALTKYVNRERLKKQLLQQKSEIESELRSL